MELTAQALANYGVTVHYILMAVLASPDRTVTRQQVESHPWKYRQAKPSPDALRKALHDMCRIHHFLEREERGLYKLSPVVTFSADALAKLT